MVFRLGGRRCVWKKGRPKRPIGRRITGKSGRMSIMAKISHVYYAIVLCGGPTLSLLLVCKEESLQSRLCLRTNHDLYILANKTPLKTLCSVSRMCTKHMFSNEEKTEPVTIIIVGHNDGKARINDHKGIVLWHRPRQIWCRCIRPSGRRYQKLGTYLCSTAYSIHPTAAHQVCEICTALPLSRGG